MIDTLITLLLYAVVYSSAYLLFWLADKTKRIRNKKNCIAVAIIFLAVFASLRNIEVGTDTSSTIALYFDAEVKYSSIKDLFSSGLAGSTLIFIFIAKVIKAVGLGYRFFLFVMELLILVPIAVVAYLRRKAVPIRITMTLFLLLYFQLSFNWIRQFIAASFLVLGVVLFINGNIKKSVIVAVLSIIFHSSAVIGIGMFAVAWVSSTSERKHARRLLIFFTIALSFLVLSNWKAIALFLINKGFLPASYRGYVNVFSGAYGTSFKSWFAVGLRTYVEFALRIALFIVPTVYGRIYGSKNFTDKNYLKEYSFFRMCALLSVLVYGTILIGLHTAYVNRLTCYLDFAIIIYLGFTFKAIGSKRKHTVTYYEAVSFLLCVVYNIWLYYILGWHETVPFYFSF